MRATTFLCLWLLALDVSSAQDTLTHSLVTIQTLVTDFDDNPLIGERILFEGQGTREVYSGISGKDGTFKISFPGGDIYHIKIKSFGEAQDYNTINIPALKKGERYPQYDLSIQIQPAQLITLDNVHFDFGKASLTKNSFPELNELLEYMRLKENAIIEIAGHTDNVGEHEDNIVLSQARADAVRNFLLFRKINDSRVTAVGYGEGQPVDTNDTPEGRQKNRRTEVRIVK